ncbi:unnamed protein product [Auanema sp. JU1783]|nr:unnamed protein product [Auanema sp. JU1783]
MIDTLSSTFLCILAHSIILLITLFDKEDILLASLPPNSWTISEESRVGLTVLLIVGLVMNIVEFGYMFQRMLSPPLAILSMFTHSLSCLLLLKFIIDAHPVSDFLWIFILLSCPNFLASTISIANTFKFR